MLLSRDYVTYLSGQLVKRLIAAQMIEARSVDALSQQIRQNMMAELTVEDRLNEEVRQILSQHADEMRRTGVSYQEMFKKVKGELERGAVLLPKPFSREVLAKTVREVLEGKKPT